MSTVFTCLSECPLPVPISLPFLTRGGLASAMAGGHHELAAGVPLLPHLPRAAAALLL